MSINATQQFSHYFLNATSDKFLNTWSDQQKKISIFALALLACLALILVCRHFLKLKNIKFSHGYVDQKQQKIVLTEDIDFET